MTNRPHRRNAPRLRVVMLRDNSDRLLAKSLAEPTTLFVASNCHKFARDGVIVEVALPVGRVLLLLAATRGRVTLQALVDCMWGERLDGGPDSAESIVRVTVAKARSLAAALQLAVTCEYALGYEFRDLRAAAAGAEVLAKSAPDVLA